MKNMAATLSMVLALTTSTSALASANSFSEWQRERGGGATQQQPGGSESMGRKELPYENMVSTYYEGNYPDIQMKMGLIFEKGLYGIPANFDEAANWYNRAAMNGNREAALKLYEYSVYQGEGKTSNEAMAWLERSAEQGNAYALFELANNTIGGRELRDVSKEDLNKTIDLYDRSIRVMEGEREGDSGAAKNVIYGVAKSRRDLVRGELRRRDASESWEQFWAPFRWTDQ